MPLFPLTHKKLPGALLALNLALGTALIGCAPFQPAAESTSTHKEATTLAKRFLTSLNQGDGDDLVKISEVPFWGDGDLISDRATFEKAARKQASRQKRSSQSTPEEDSMVAHTVPFEALEAISPRMYNKLKAAMDTENLYVVFVSALNEGRKRRENGLILVRKGKAGAWAVVGIDD